MNGQNYSRSRHMVAEYRLTGQGNRMNAIVVDC
jgi:hypothetical protein